MLDATPALVGAVLLLVTVYLGLHVHVRVTQDSREPPLVEAGVPYMTPLLNLVNAKYFSRIRNKHPSLPLYTLRLPGTRVYVINSTKLIASTQRHPKNFTFQAIQDRFAYLVCNLSPVAVQVQKREFDHWINNGGNVASPSHAAFEELLPGKSLDDMNRSLVVAFGKECNSWASGGEGGVERDLFAWVKETVTIAVMDGVYGDANPYRDEAVRKHFWAYNAGVGTLSMGAVGKLLGRKSLNSLSFIAGMFRKYYQQGHHLRASKLTSQRYEWHKSRGFPLNDTANMEVGHGIAILSNTIPTAFWLILHIFADAKVLDACRAEILSHVTGTKSINGDLSRSLDITKLTDSCPILQSALKETMRFHGKGVGVRGVLRDHMLDERYLLRKDSVILIPSTIQHFDTAHWGADASEFHHDRFTDPARPRVNNTAFRGFGGGSTLCPGRHFAMTAILAFAAMLVLGFDVKPRKGGWIVPSAEKADLTKVMPSPDFDIGVVISRRKDNQGVMWEWRLSGQGTDGLEMGEEYGDSLDWK